MAQCFRSSASCVIKAVQYPARTSEDAVRAVVRAVDQREAEGTLEPWSQEDVPETLLEVLPERGAVVSTRTFPLLDATELTLSNGMRVCYKVTRALEDQVLLHAFAAGGLSEVPPVRTGGTGGAAGGFCSLS